jgi:hypothetical protein
MMFPPKPFAVLGASEARSIPPDPGPLVCPHIERPARPPGDA